MENMKTIANTNLINSNKLNFNLEINKRYTIILPNDLIPATYNCTLLNYYFSSYAQYENCLFLFVKLKGHRKITRITITNTDTVIILDGWNYNSSWRKEKISTNESRLHRLTIDDFDKKDIVFYKKYGEEFQTNRNQERFMDLTADYLMNNNINPREAINNEGYINCIKELLRKEKFSVKYMLDATKDMSILNSCLKLAIQYEW